MPPVYKPPMSLQETMSFLNSTGLFKQEKPIELDDAIMEANKLEQDEIKTEAINRAERVRQKIAENSLDEFGNPLPIDDVIKKASVFSLQEGDTDTAFKLYDLQDKREREEEQRVSRLMSQVRQIGAVNPQAAVDKINSSKELKSLYGEVSPYDFEKLKTMGDDLGYYEDGQFVPTQRGVRPPSRSERKADITYILNKNTEEVIPIDKNKDFEKYEYYARDIKNYEEVKDPKKIENRRRMIAAERKLKEKEESKNTGGSSIGDLINSAKSLFTGKDYSQPETYPKKIIKVRRRDPSDG